MITDDEELLEAVRDLRSGRRERLDRALAEIVPDGRHRPPARSSAPWTVSGHSVEAWADRVIRCTFDFVGAGRWEEADLIGGAAATVFSEIDDPAQHARMLAAAAVTALGADRLDEAFDLAVRAMVQLWGGGLGRSAAASTANSLGTFFDRLGARDLAIEQFETALALLDTSTELGGRRAELTIQNLVICLHEVVNDRRAHALAAPSAHMDRLRELVGALPAASDHFVVNYTIHFGTATVALVEQRYGDAVRAAEQLDRERDSMVVREELSWRLLGAAALFGADRLTDAVQWATEALRLATLGEPFRVPEARRLRAAINWALDEQTAAFADAMAAVDSLSVTRSARIAGLAAGLADRARLELVRRELSDESASLAITAARDPLTGLANRRGLDEVIGILSQTQQRAAALVVDIDHFKQVNDTYGHEAGDHVIRACADLLRDAVGTAGLIARLGGDEFVIVLPGGHAHPRHLGEELCRAARAYDWGRIAAGLAVTVSVGAAIGAARDLRELMARSDRALYEAKRAGRDRVVSVDRRRWPRELGD